ncbi:uncharacterized protein LOC125500350 [Athalia rosae]|uniref:uncharacterized protein LOC125500350 n=1 Tax=Athalia rosae TaxID=37344 RepID=UPI002033D451|nr:uncharacterized protein LOC125500350 [Athalia rosae]
MRNTFTEICKNEENYKKIKKRREGRVRPVPDKSGDSESRDDDKSRIFESSSSIKTQSLRLTKNRELYCTLQAVLLASSVLVLSYSGVLYGKSEYRLLENGPIVSDFVSPSRTVVTLNLGYSAPYALVSSIAASMLVYSLVTRDAQWSFPSMVLCMADIVCDVGDAAVAIWLFFGNLKITTAIIYTVGTVVIIRTSIDKFYSGKYNF